MPMPKAMKVVKPTFPTRNVPMIVPKTIELLNLWLLHAKKSTRVKRKVSLGLLMKS